MQERLRELKDLRQESLLQYLRYASALALQSQDVTDGREPTILLHRGEMFGMTSSKPQ